MKTFGDRIKEARKAKALTQKELAAKIGAAHNSISDWEKNKNKPDPDTIELLCGVLEISPNYLLDVASDGFSPKEKALIEKYRAIDDRGRSFIDYILDEEYYRAIQVNELFVSEDEEDYLYLGKIAAAGTWVYPGDIPLDRIKVRKLNGADFVVGVSGDSMQPTYEDGDKVYVKKTTEIEFGDIGLFVVNGYYYIKEYAPDGLRSHNPQFSLIPKDRDIIVVGKVLGKVEE